MAKTRVVNISHGDPYDMYIGRSMPGYEGHGFGNPFKVGSDGTREEVLEKYVVMIMRHPEFLARVATLKGLTLGCWCAPLPCHGYVLAAIADASGEDDESGA